MAIWSIAARYERYVGTDGIARDYTSARLTTRRRFAFEYGTVAARIKLPSGDGLWPAFWLLGTNIDEVDGPLAERSM